jgi:hypothetical protein
MGIPDSGGIETNQSQRSNHVKILFRPRGIRSLWRLPNRVAGLGSPKVEAAESAVVAKGDRLQMKVSVLNCANEVWPQVAARCLRSAEGSKVLEARIVTTSH